MKPLILLHGALGSPSQFKPLAAALSQHYEVHCPPFPGHAGLPPRDFSMEGFAEDLERYISEKGLERPAVFGYSMGGYAALLLALHRPGLLERVCTLATKFQWNPESAAREAQMLQPEVMEQKVPVFAQALQVRHAPLDWKEVAAGTAALMKQLGNNPPLTDEALSTLRLPVELLLGAKDAMVTLDETLGACKAIPGATLGILPATPHPLEKVDVELLALMLRKFIEEKPALAPAGV